MLAIQTDLGWFDKNVKLLAAILCQLDRKLPFITLVYLILLLLVPYDSWLERMGQGVGIVVQNFLNIFLCALLFCLSFFSLLNLGVTAKRACRAALILSLTLIIIHGNISDLTSNRWGVFLNWISSALGVFVGYAIVHYYLVMTSIGKWE